MTFQGTPGRPPGPWERAPPPRPPTRRYAYRLLIFCAVLTALVLLLVSYLPPTTLRGEEGPRVAQALILAAYFAVMLAVSRRSLSSIGRTLLFWFIAVMLLVGAYGYRFELRALGQRIFAELVPAQGQVEGNGVITYQRSADGQFWINATVDGKPVRFMVDTGASGMMLTRADADRLGFGNDQLNFNQSFDTANGPTRGAAVTLDRVEIGPLSFEHVPASVSEGDAPSSLLGMHLLQRLGSLEIHNDTLTLRR